MNLNQDQLLTVLGETVRQLRQDVDPSMTLGRLATLVAIYKEPGVAQEELLKKAAPTNPSTLSRNVLDLGDWTSQRKPGPGLVEARPNPQYRKQNLLYPTAKGNATVARLLQHINAELEKVK